MEQAREKGKRWVISTHDEMQQAAIEVVREASRKVSIFTHDLEPGIYDSPEFLEIIKRMVLSQTYARIRVLIADPSKAVKNGNDAFPAFGLQPVDEGCFVCNAECFGVGPQVLADVTKFDVGVQTSNRFGRRVFGQ